METRPPAQLRRKPATLDAASGAWPETSAQRVFVAKLVQARDLRPFPAAQGARDRALAWVAGRQLGVVATWQLRAIGFSEATIRRRVRRGALHRIFRGAFLVGHAMAVPGARELAAVLACGHDAVVSHLSAAALWGLAAQFPACVEVSMTTGHRRCHGELVVHRPRRLEANDRTMKNGIPVTSPARTLVDFAATATPEELERALAQARVQRLVSDQALAGALGRAGKRAGVAALRAALLQEGGPQLTRSEAERRLLQMIRVAGLAEPVANARVAGYEVDFLWPDARVIVEVDGFAFHSHRSAFERDRTRDMVLRVRATR